MRFGLCVVLCVHQRLGLCVVWLSVVCVCVCGRLLLGCAGLAVLAYILHRDLCNTLPTLCMRLRPRSCTLGWSLAGWVSTHDTAAPAVTWCGYACLGIVFAH